MEHNASIDDIGDFLEKYCKNKKTIRQKAKFYLILFFYEFN